MAKIIYKKGHEGQNKLSAIEGIEIDLFNGQKALIYPQYAERQMLTADQIIKCDITSETEIEALKVTETLDRTIALLDMGSPAAKWVSQFWSDRYGIFTLPSLLAVMEIQHQSEEIDDLAKAIEGADLLKDFSSLACSCSRSGKSGCWFVDRFRENVDSSLLDFFLYIVVPTILYR